jgi:hypothetical protein
MKKNLFLPEKKNWQIPSLLAVIFLLLSTPSCNDNKTGKTDVVADAASCIVLTKTQINSKWIPAFTKPGIPPDKQLVGLKLFSSYNPITQGYDVKIVGVNASSNTLGDLFTLSSGVACGISLPALSTGQSNDVSFSKLGIIKADGTLVDKFDKIVFTPYPYKIGEVDYLAYNVDVIVGDTRRGVESALPCPPCQNCRPIPEGCLIQADTTKDNPIDTIRKN